MSTDRELLDLMFKASGDLKRTSFFVGSEEISYMEGVGILVEDPKALPHTGGARWWNPLTDDGDALRLAAKLRLCIKPGKHLGDGCTVETQRAGVAGCTAFYDEECEQMRRAITSAAAEIGRSLP